VVPTWRASALWDEAYLLSEHGGATVYAGGYPFALRDYLRYARSVTRDDAPLYLCVRARMRVLRVLRARIRICCASASVLILRIIHSSSFFPHILSFRFDRDVLGATALGSHYAPPPQLRGVDFFSCLGEAGRPAYRWLIAGPARSGSTWHKDPNATSAWNGVVRGAKKWLLFPPHAPPPGVAASADGAHVSCPLALTEWLLAFYDQAAALPGGRECVCAAGELLFVPSGWWHMAVNLEPCVAVTQNFVSEATLPKVLAHLATCSADLVSGCAPDARGGLHARFVAAMAAQHPAELAAAQRALEKQAAAAAARKRAAAICEGEGARAFTFSFAPPPAEEQQGGA
jgi:hypothetical protein